MSEGTSEILLWSERRVRRAGEGWAQQGEGQGQKGEGQGQEGEGLVKAEEEVELSDPR